MQRRFNGAALIRARKSFSASKLHATSSVLQRGRAHSSAEIYTFPSMLPQVKQRFNGAALIRARKSMRAKAAPALWSTVKQRFNGAALIRARK